MKEKLITAWSSLNRKRFEVEDGNVYPIWHKMDRIQRVLFYRYGYFVSYYSPF